MGLTIGYEWHPVSQDTRPKIDDLLTGPRGTLEEGAFRPLGLGVAWTGLRFMVGNKGFFPSESSLKDWEGEPFLTLFIYLFSNARRIDRRYEGVW